MRIDGGFVIVDKDSGVLITDKVYTSEGRANAAIRKWNVSDADTFAVIPMPSSRILKEIAEGSFYTVVKYQGRLPVGPERDY